MKQIGFITIIIFLAAVSILHFLTDANEGKPKITSESLEPNNGFKNRVVMSGELFPGKTIFIPVRSKPANG